LRTRLQGGKLNKAKKGELLFPLPVGFRYDEQSRIILDPMKKCGVRWPSCFAYFARLVCLRGAPATYGRASRASHCIRFRTAWALICTRYW